MAAQHTPGPWHLRRPAGAPFASAVTVTPDSADGDIANILRGLGAKYPEVALANARLIAAAPDLLEALKRSAEGWANAIELGLIPKQHVGSATILRDNARAAIAKATSPADAAGPSAATDRTS